MIVSMNVSHFVKSKQFTATKHIKTQQIPQPQDMTKQLFQMPSCDQLHNKC